MHSFLSSLRSRYDSQPWAKFTNNAGWLYAEQALKMALGFVLVAVMARTFGPEKYGVYSFAIAFTGLFSAVAYLGIEKIFIKYLVEGAFPQKELVGTAIVLRFIAGIITALLALIVVLLLDQDLVGLLLVGILALIPVFQSFQIIDYWYQSKVQAKYPVIIRSVSFLIIFLVKISVLLLSPSLIAYAVLTLVEYLLISLGLWWYFHLHGQGFVLKIDRNIAKKLLSESAPLILSGIFVTLYMKIDQVLLAQMTTTREVGLYSAAVGLSQIPTFVGLIVIQTMFPSIVALKKNKLLFNQAMKKLFSMLALISISISLPISIMSGLVVNVVYGSEFSEAGIILAIHIWSLIFIFYGIAAGSWLVSQGLTKYSYLITGSGAIVNVVLNLILIPHFGAIGASMATIISYAVAGVFINLFPSSLRQIFKVQISSVTQR